MIAAIIFVCSVVFLLQFFVSYSRSLIAASNKHALSAEVQDVAGITRPTSGEDFARVMQLLHLCPERPEERGRIRAVAAYYRLLDAIDATIARRAPSVLAWAKTERAQCTYFAAVTLDQRIAFSRDLVAQESAI